MERIFANLYRFVDEPFHKGKKYSYLLLRKQGNLMLCHFKRPCSVTEHFDEIERLGGVHAQFVTHNHESTSIHDQFHARFGCKLYYHKAERAAVRRKSKCASEVFGDDGLQLDTDFQAVFFPGDTPGTTIYRWRYRGKHLWFTGHVANLVDGDWRIRLKPNSKPQLRSQFAELPKLPVDYVFPCRTHYGLEEFYRLTDETRKSFRKTLKGILKASQDQSAGNS